MQQFKQEFNLSLEISEILSLYWQSSKDSKSPEEFMLHTNEANKNIRGIIEAQKEKDQQEIERRKKDLDSALTNHEEIMRTQLDNFSVALSETHKQGELEGAKKLAEWMKQLCTEGHTTFKITHLNCYACMQSKLAELEK